jgi:hypothetical protein
VVGGGARRQRRDDLINVQSQTEDWLLDVARSEIMAWMEGGGSGIRHGRAGGREMTWAWRVCIYLSHAFHRVQAATKKASHYIVSFTATFHPRRKHVSQVSSR